MLYVMARSLALQLGVFAAILLVTSGVVLAVQGEASCLSFMSTIVRDMLGPWVWTLGFGLYAFIRAEGRVVGTYLAGMLDPTETTAAAIGQIERGSLARHGLRVTLPITLLGFVLTLTYGAPGHGLAQWILILGITSIYYAAAFLLYHFVSLIRVFQYLYSSLDKLRFQTDISPLHIEGLMTYFSLTTTIGVLAIYVGLRGTITAGFSFTHEVFRSFLLTPIVLFLPATLLYNFYPRYVLRKLVQHRVLDSMIQLGSADPSQVRSLLLDIKTITLTNAQLLPFVDYKSLPSYLIAVLFVLTLVYNYDSTVRSFLLHLFGATGTQ